MATWWIHDDPPRTEPTPNASKIAQRPGVEFVELSQHKLWVVYKDNYLTMKSMPEELTYLQKIIEGIIARKLGLVRVSAWAPLIADDCTIWKDTPYKCYGDVLYIPKEYALPWQKIEGFVGVLYAGVRLQVGSNKSGHNTDWGIIVKSRLHSWASLKPQLPSK